MRVDDLFNTLKLHQDLVLDDEVGPEAFVELNSFSGITRTRLSLCVLCVSARVFTKAALQRGRGVSKRQGETDPR